MTSCPTKGCFTRRVPPFKVPAGYENVQVKVLVGCGDSPCPDASAEASKSLKCLGDGIYHACYKLDEPAGTAVAELVTACCSETGEVHALYSDSWNMPGLCERDVDAIVAKMLTTDLCDPRLVNNKYWRDIRQNTLAMFLLVHTQNQRWQMTTDRNGNKRLALNVEHCGRVITTLFNDVVVQDEHKCHCSTPLPRADCTCNQCNRRCC